MPKRCCHIILFLLLCAQQLRSQDLTGVWEGIMNEDELLQINIQQKDKQLCGYTYDHLLVNLNDHCRAGFSGTYDKKKDLWLLSGTGFIENSGLHRLMLIQLWKEPGDAPDVLRARQTVKSVFGFTFWLGTDMILRRVSADPDMSRLAVPCFPKNDNRPKTTDDQKPVREDGRPPITIANVPEDSTSIKDAMPLRKQTEQARVKIDVEQINLKIYDNGVTDNDTVSVFYNGKLLLSHQRLSEKPINIDIDLDKKTSLHEIVLYAENLGGIPPNTALVVVTAGSKRYELRSKASLEENAVLIFESQ